MDEEKRLRIALLAMPESSAATLYGMYDMFCSVGRDWSMLTKGELGPGFIETCIVSKDGEGFYSSNGAWIQPQLSLSADPGADVICIPDLMVSPGQSIRDCYPTEITWLLRHYSGGHAQWPGNHNPLGLLRGHARSVSESYGACGTFGCACR